MGLTAIGCETPPLARALLPGACRSNLLARPGARLDGEQSEEVARLLATAQTVDAAEDEQYGKDRRGDELPAELARRESRLAKIREAKAALEQEARERAARDAEAARAKIEQRRRKEKETGKEIGGRPPEVPDPEKAVPEPKAQRNFTDPESRIMASGAASAGPISNVVRQQFNSA